MSTTIRPEVSEKNKYWIERHRYYELKHFCLQYYIWKRAYSALDGLNGSNKDPRELKSQNLSESPTERYAMSKIYYRDRVELVNRVALLTSEELSKYILIGVTEGLSYEQIKARLDIPCCKDVYYELYRRFFWILDRERQ